MEEEEKFNKQFEEEELELFKKYRQEMLKDQKEVEEFNNSNDNSNDNESCDLYNKSR